MHNLKPTDLVLRCYGRKKDGAWYGLCLELNLAAEARSPEELKGKLKAVIIDYLTLVYDTDDHDSIPDLLSRKAPLQDWLIYYYIAFIRKLKTGFTFNELIPCRIAC